jgi:Tfp pilus assembly protein PilV
VAKIKFDKRLKGSTLLEALIAMVLLLICIIVSAGVINNIVQSADSADKLRAELLLSKWMSDTRYNSQFVDEETTSADLKLTKKVTRLTGYDDMVYIRLVATNKEARVVGEKKMLIKISP